MANKNRCDGCGRRNSNNAYGCLSCLGGRHCREYYPYYEGPCPGMDGGYDLVKGAAGDDGYDRRSGRSERRSPFGIFTAMLPMAVAPNGIIPLVNSNCLGIAGDFAVNSGLITVEEQGTYLATYTVRVPEGQTVASNFTLNVNDASQSSAITEVGGAGPIGFTAQAIIDVGDRATVALRSSEAINVTEPSTQPLVTLSLVKI